MRTGAALVRASQVYAKEDIGKSWRLLFTTLLVFAACWATIIFSDAWYVDLFASSIAGLTGVRLFIFYHDYCHGAIFRKSKPGKWIMSAVGWYTLAVPSVWTETHNYHHRNNAKLIGSSIGSYPTVSLRMYKYMDDTARRQLKVIRHPVTIAAGLLTTFMTGFSVAAYRRDTKKHWTAPVALVTWLLMAVALGFAFGVANAIWLWVVPCAIHAAIGSYMFYAQHNYPEAELRDRRKWEYNHAALKCSSYFEMSPLMHWFTGNIGYHHVHHLNHRIPFYRLPEAMAEMPELQNPGRTSWKLNDIRACLNCSVWDGRQQKLISFKEADEARFQHQQALAAK